MSEVIEDNANLIQNTSGIIAAINLEKMGKGVAGNLVTPATWALNYTVKGTKPDIIDLGIYAVGLANVPTGIFGSSLKAYMDDDIARKVKSIRHQQEAKFRPFILPVQSYQMLQPLMVALNIAMAGGTAWQGKNGQWVYITDAKGHLVADYEPKNALKVWRPKTPLTLGTNGKYEICSETC